MDQNTSKKWHSYFFAFLCLFLTASSAVSLSAFDMVGKTVTVFDGKNKKSIHTNAADFKDVLAILRIKMGPHDTYWTSTADVEDGSILVVERAKLVTVVSGMEAKRIHTTQQTVQGVVNDAGFDWKTMMPVEDGLSQLRDGMTIHVVPYTKKVETRREKRPVNYVKWHDARLSSGEEAVIDCGQAGEEIVTVEECISDGKVIRSSLLRSEVIAEGMPGSMRTGDTKNTVGEVYSMTATAYHPSDGDGRGITATGTKAGYGTVAVDPDVIPLGSAVYIPGYGDAVASDTGGAIVGNRIDLCMETFSECYDFGVKNVDVFVPY